jgi:hypothetical protein
MRALGIMSLAAAILFVAAPRQAGAQSPPPESAAPAVESDSDPTRPVFFSLRPEFYKVGDEVEQQVLMVRFDAVAAKTRRILQGSRGFIVRLDVPVTRANVLGDEEGGIGDAYAQVFVVPFVRGRFAWAVGSGVILPTATDTLLGGGKWVVAPVAVPVWRAPRRLFFVKVQNFTSVAGGDGRADLNYLLVTPTFIHVVQPRWWVLVDSEAKTKWNDGNRTGVKSGFQLGHRVATRLGVWVKPEVWWGPNRDGQWNLKFGAVWYRR